MLLPDQSAETVVVIGYIRAVAVGYLFQVPIASCIGIAGKGNSGTVSEALAPCTWIFVVEPALKTVLFTRLFPE